MEQDGRKSSSIFSTKSSSKNSDLNIEDMFPVPEKELKKDEVQSSNWKCTPGKSLNKKKHTEQQTSQLNMEAQHFIDLFDQQLAADFATELGIIPEDNQIMGNFHTPKIKSTHKGISIKPENKLLKPDVALKGDKPKEPNQKPKLAGDIEKKRNITLVDMFGNTGTEIKKKKDELVKNREEKKYVLAQKQKAVQKTKDTSNLNTTHEKTPADVAIENQTRILMKSSSKTGALKTGESAMKQVDTNSGKLGVDRRVSKSEVPRPIPSLEAQKRKSIPDSNLIRTEGDFPPVLLPETVMEEKEESTASGKSRTNAPSSLPSQTEDERHVVVSPRLSKNSQSSEMRSSKKRGRPPKQSQQTSSVFKNLSFEKLEGISTLVETCGIPSVSIVNSQTDFVDEQYTDLPSLIPIQAIEPSISKSDRKHGKSPKQVVSHSAATESTSRESLKDSGIAVAPAGCDPNSSVDNPIETLGVKSTSEKRLRVQPNEMEVTPLNRRSLKRQKVSAIQKKI